MPANTRELIVPDYITAALKKNKKALAAFEAFSYSHKNEYVKWITEKFLSGIEIYLPSLVINNAFRNWAHQLLYDRELLTIALQKVGFADIKIYKNGQSDDEILKGIERHGINIGNVQMADFETLILEATKP